jgi:hypothetical protein
MCSSVVPLFCCLQQKWAAVKKQKKAKLAALIKKVG